MSSSLVTRALRARRPTEQKAAVGWPAIGWAPPPGYIADVAGVKVNSDSVLGTAAAWASVTLIARSMARLPLFTFRFRDDGGKDKARDHRLYRLLHDSPNPSMTSWSWRAAAVGHQETWGSSFAEIERNGFDEILGIHPRRPERWRVEWKAGKKVFYYQQPDKFGREVELEAERVFHVPAFSPDGLVGYPPVTLHRRSFALGIAAMEYGTRVFANDARPGVILMHPKTFNDRAIEKLEESWIANHQGPENAGKVALLEEGVKAEQFGFPPEDAQFLETRRFQRDETDDIFGVPVGFRGSADPAMAIKFVVWTLGTRLVMWEQEIKRQLIGFDEDVFAEHAVEGLLRGNWAERAAFYASGRTNGWLNLDEIRAMENLNPIPDGAGQGFLQPLNMQPVGGAQGSPDRNPSPSTGNPDSPVAPNPDTALALLSRDLSDPALDYLRASQPSRNGRSEVTV